MISDEDTLYVDKEKRIFFTLGQYKGTYGDSVSYAVDYGLNAFLTRTPKTKFYLIWNPKALHWVDLEPLVISSFAAIGFAVEPAPTTSRNVQNRLNATIYPRTSNGLRAGRRFWIPCEKRRFQFILKYGK